MLYLLIVTLVSSALVQYRSGGRDHSAVLGIHGHDRDQRVAGAQILQSRPDPLGADVHSVVSGMSVVLWASGTWLIPLLLAVGAWAM
jgi:hypothetical protein